MESLITFNNELVQTLIAESHADVVHLKAMLLNTKSMSNRTRETLFCNDWDMRYAHKKEASVNLLQDLITNAAWNEFLNHYSYYKTCTGNTYSETVHTCLMADTMRRRYYDDVKRLTPFTQEAAKDFFDRHIADTTERRKKNIAEFLHKCGASHTSSPAVFKHKMTLRGLSSYGDTAVMLGRVLQIACWLHGAGFARYDENPVFTWDAYYTCLNSIPAAGIESKPMLGLPITIEKHLNGNSTLRIDRSLAHKLNKFV